VSGTGRTNVSLIIEVMVLVIYIIFTAIMVGVLNASIVQVWYVEVLYGMLLTVFSFAYLKSDRWKGKQV
jgi:Na+-driven multidrug efflux pump